MRDKDALLAIVARCRRVEWPVEQSTGGQDWLYRVTCADGSRVQLHSSPSDVNWERSVWRQLRAGGFDEAEAAWKERDEAERKAKLDADRQKAEAKAARLAEQALQAQLLVKTAGPYAGPEEVDADWLLTPTRWPQTKTVILTPVVAKMVLDQANTRNRQLKGRRVTYFENLIRSGEFGCTHQGGAMDWNGVLIDGQSRCQAVVNTDTAVPMQWSVGMDPCNFARVDTGENRSGADTAYIKGEADPGTTSAATKMLLCIDAYGPQAHLKSRQTRISNDRIHRAIDAYGDPLRKAVHQAKALKREIRRANPSALTAALYLITQRLPAGDPRVVQFFEDFEFGEHIAKTDPVWLLRRILLNGPNDGGRYYNRWSQLAFIIKAWNLRSRGETRQNLVWRQGEPFPSAVFLPPPIEQEAGAA